MQDGFLRLWEHDLDPIAELDMSAILQEEKGNADHWAQHTARNPTEQ